VLTEYGLRSNPGYSVSWFNIRVSCVEAVAH